MFCIREKVLGVITIQQNDKPTQICKRKVWIRSLISSAIMGKGCSEGYPHRNHRIFTLRCISHNLIPVSIKLKPSDSKLGTEAMKIIQ